MRTIIICCEGLSEYMYIQELRRFLRDIGDPSNLLLNFCPEIIGQGHFGPAQTKLRQVARENKRTNIEVWIDYDLYHVARNERKSRTHYLEQREKNQIRVFHFSHFNFEDFLILHYSGEEMDLYQQKFRSGHFRAPLTKEIYLPLFREIFPDYRKGALPQGFTVNQTTLGNLKRNHHENIRQEHSVESSPRSDMPEEFPHFADFLLAQLETAYPELYERLS